MRFARTSAPARVVGESVKTNVFLAKISTLKAVVCRRVTLNLMSISWDSTELARDATLSASQAVLARYVDVEVLIFLS